MQISEEEKKAVDTIKYNDIAKLLACGDMTICNIDDLKFVLNIIEKQNKELMLSKLGEIGKQGCLKCKTVENAVNLRRDNIKLKQEIKVLKNDTYWKGYIDKQNEAAEICKQCKYIKSNKLKDKMIEGMAKYIEESGIMHKSVNVYSNDKNIPSTIAQATREEIKEYFRKKAENE